MLRPPGLTVSSAVENRAAPTAVTLIWTLCPAASDPEAWLTVRSWSRGTGTATWSAESARRGQ